MSTSPLEEWNRIDTFTETFPVYNCAFLDILGYKQKVGKYFDQRFNLFGRVNRALDKAMLARNVTAVLLRTEGLSVEIVSDSIIMLQPAVGPALGALLPFACWFSSLLSFEGLFIRGGISRGRHVRKKTPHGFDFLASEALQKAYLLESQRAVFPRILIDNDIIGSLPTEESRLIVKENDDFILHFAPNVINRDGKNFADVHGEMIDLQRGMDSEESENVKSKYRWLLDYYFWTIASNPAWDSAPFRAFSSAEKRNFSLLPEESDSDSEA